MDDYEASTVFMWSIISIIIIIYLFNNEGNKRFLCESTLCQIQFYKLDSIDNKTMRISSVLQHGQCISNPQALL